jgi:hypothetical protein
VEPDHLPQARHDGTPRHSAQTSEDAEPQSDNRRRGWGAIRSLLGPTEAFSLRLDIVRNGIFDFFMLIPVVLINVLCEKILAVFSPEHGMSRTQADILLWVCFAATVTIYVLYIALDCAKIVRRIKLAAKGE